MTPVIVIFAALAVGIDSRPPNPSPAVVPEQERQLSHGEMVRACMEYARPPETVVFTQRGEEGQRLRLSPRDDNYRIPDYGRTTAYQPKEWRLLNPNPPFSGTDRASWYGSLLFMHGRKTPKGDELLAVVTWQHNGRRGLQVTLLRLDAADPAKRHEVTSFVVPRGELLGAQDPQPLLEVRQELRFLAGQPDRNDPTAWTIAYSVAEDGQSPHRAGTIEMKLTGEPSLPNHQQFPLAISGGIPVRITVTRPDDSRFLTEWSTPPTPTSGIK